MNSFVTKWPLPIAATRISALLATLAKSSVLECVKVTVESAPKSKIAIGLPTMLLRPITTACLPANGILYSLNISLMPYGVQGIV